MSGIDVVVEQLADQTNALAAKDVPRVQRPTEDVARRAQGAPAGERLAGELACSPDAGVSIVELVALGDEGRTALIVDPSCAGTSAVRARVAVDLHGAHIGKSVVLMFEQSDPTRPIVIGVLRNEAWPLDRRPDNVEVCADGHRLVISAKEHISLRCGKASITLTRAGKILIEGTYLLSRSTTVNRIKGGSVQIN